jgi:hypothetical protein
MITVTEHGWYDFMTKHADHQRPLWRCDLLVSPVISAAMLRPCGSAPGISPAAGRRSTSPS